MKHKISFLLTLAIVTTVSLQAQLNVGSTSPADVSAILQATSTTKGFLPPVMTTTQINAILLPANGLTVYNTTLSQLQVNVGTPAVPSWAVGAGGANVYWSQQGNTGTVPVTNYVGTTDNASIAFRTNNAERMRIDSSTGFVGIGTTTPYAQLQLGNTSSNKKIVMYDAGTTVANDSSFYGFGANGSALRYQVPAGAGHSFYINKTLVANMGSSGTMTINGSNPAYSFTDRSRTNRFGNLYVADGIIRLWGSQNADLFSVDSIGNVGIGTVASYAPLQFSNSVVNRKIVLYDQGINSGNDSSFYGFGINGGTLRYQVPTGANHSFYSNKSQIANLASGGAFTLNGASSGFAVNDQTRAGRAGGFYIKDGIVRIWQNIAGEAITMDSTGEVTINKRISMNNGNNMFIGSQSGLVTSNGGNTFLGIQTGMVNTSGNYNGFTGYQSGVSNTTGARNTFNGANSGTNNSTGAWNTFTGSLSGNNNTTGYENTYIGGQSGYSNTTGIRNVFLGLNSGYQNTTASDNVFIGWHTGNTTTTGGANTFLGRDAGASNSTGYYNVSTGFQSGFNITSGIENVFSGVNSGINNTTGSQNTSLGSYSGPASAGLTNTTSIGYNTQATQSNTVILGSGASVGINTTTPSRTLQVNGAIKAGLDNVGSIALNPGNSSRPGFIEFWKGGSTIRNGYIGDDPTDLYYRAENGAQHRFSGANVIIENLLNVGGPVLMGQGGLPAGHSGTAFTWNSYQGGFGESEIFNYSGLGPGGFRFYRVYSGNTPGAGNWTAFISSSGAYSQVSDERTKTNIKTVANGLSTIMALHPISYNLHLDRTIKNGVVTFGKEDEVSKQFGFSAQEMYKVLPEAVDKPKDVANELYSVSYATVIPILTKAIQEQQVQIEKQVALNKHQQAQIAIQVALSKQQTAEIALLKKENLVIAAQLSDMKELKIAMAQMRSDLNKTTVTQAVLPMPVTVKN